MRLQTSPPDTSSGAPPPPKHRSPQIHILCFWAGGDHVWVGTKPSPQGGSTSHTALLGRVLTCHDLPMGTVPGVQGDRKGKKGGRAPAFIHQHKNSHGEARPARWDRPVLEQMASESHFHGTLSPGNHCQAFSGHKTLFPPSPLHT